MSRKVGTVIRVGSLGYRAARELYRKVETDGWDAVGINAADAPKKITMGSVVAAVLAKTVRDKIRLGFA